MDRQRERRPGLEPATPLFEPPRPALLPPAPAPVSQPEPQLPSQAQPQSQPRAELQPVDDPREQVAERAAESALAEPDRASSGEPPLKPDGSATPRVAPRRALDAAPPRDVDVDGAVARGLGAPARALDTPVRADMERRFGHSFADVRVHAEGEAGTAARELGARAWTYGRDIVFAPEQYTPASAPGRTLLAHELAHVVQQGAAPVVQRWPWDSKPPAAPAPAPAGGVTTAPPTPTGAPPSTTPAPANAAAQAGRELIDKALKSRSAGDVKDIKDFSTATDRERLDLIDILLNQKWVGPFDEYKIEDIWRSYGDRLPEILTNEWSISLWHKSIDKGAELHKLKPVQDALKAFMGDVQGLAIANLRANRPYIKAEIDRLGIGADKPTAEQNKEASMMGDAAVDIRKAWGQQDELKKVTVGYDIGKTPIDETPRAIISMDPHNFHPFMHPEMNLSKTKDDSDRDWKVIKGLWDGIQTYIDGIANAYPALFAVIQQERALTLKEKLSDEDHSAEGPMARLSKTTDPGQVRKILGEALTKTAQLIDAAEVKVAGNKPDYRDMTPIHAALMEGRAPSISGRIWRSGFNKLMVDQDLQRKHDADFYKEFGVSTLAGAAFVFVNFATFGTATFFFAAAAGLALTGGKALESMEQYQQLDAASRTNLNTKTAIVDKEAVFHAGQKAMQDVTEFLQMVATVGGKAIETWMKRPPDHEKLDSPDSGPVTERAAGKGATWKEPEMRAHLANTPEGREAQEIQKKYKIDVIYNDEGKGGTYYKPPRTVVISRHESSAEAALSFIHEMGHAEHFHTGMTASLRVKQLGRQQYISAMCMEEATVEARAVRAKFESNRSGDYDGAAAGERVYSKAAAARMRQVRAENPNFSEDHIIQQGRFAGEQALYKAFLDGTYKGSQSGTTYPEQLGAYWDKVHGAGGSGSATRP